MNDIHRSVFTEPTFKFWLSSRFLTNFARQMQALVVAWQVYQLTKDPLALGLVGLAEALPFFVGAFWAGHLADTHERRNILMFSQVGFSLCAALLCMMTLFARPSLVLIYLLIGLAGLCTSFEVAAAGSYIQTLIPRDIFPKAAAWNLTLFTGATIFGPIVAGAMVDKINIGRTYGVAAVFYLLAVFFTLRLRKIHPQKHDAESQHSGLKRILSGVRFIWSEKLLLGSMSLDLFAVLFGGAVALFPIFADIFNVGPTGLGFLQAAPAAGAFAMAFANTRGTFFKTTWNTLCVAVAVFGLSMVGFALSTNFILALAFLVLSGVVDSMSVIIRSSILQAVTPDHLRGRVVSVGSMFIRSSNEIGAFESGVAAKFMGTVTSVVVGGTLTLASVVFMRWKFKELDPS